MANGRDGRATRSAQTARIALLMSLSAHFPFSIFHFPCSASASENLRDSESGQQQVMTRTQAVATQIDSIVGEFETNGIGDNDDLKTLRAVRGALGSLSDEQMRQVVELLRQARESSDPAVARSKSADAFAGQRAIIAQLRALLVEYQRRDAQRQLSVRLDKLAERQNANLKAGVDLAKQTMGKPISALEAPQKESLRAQQNEQAQLKEQVAQAVADLAALAVNAAGEDRLKEAAAKAREGKPAESAAMAADDLADGTLLRAASNEKSARDQLRELARLVAPPKERSEQLREASAKIDAAMQAEQDILEASRVSKREEYDVTERKQGELVDQIDAMRKDLTGMAPQAVEDLQVALASMQQARAALAGKSRSAAVKGEQAAMESLTAAKVEIDRQLGKDAAKQDAPPTEAVAAAKQLAQKAADLKQQQNKLTAQTTGPATPPMKPADAAQRQAELEQQTKDLRADVAERMPEAAKALEAAAQQMDAAERDLAKGRRKQAAKEQQTAAEQLTEAQRQIGEQVKATEQAQADVNKIEKTRQQVAEAMIRQAEAYTATASGTPVGRGPARQEQQAAEDLAAQAAKELPESGKSAAAPLEQARQAMSGAKQKLAAEDASGAQPKQREAMAGLQKAKNALDEKLPEMQRALGIEPDPKRSGEAMEEIIRELKTAQGEVQAAQGELAKGDPQQSKQDEHAQAAANHLEKAAMAASKASAEDQGVLAKAAKETLRQAQEQIEQGIENARKSDSKEARANAEKAQEALASATAAAKLAAEGMKSQKPGEQTAQGPPGEQPGAKPGEAPGDKPGEQPGQQASANAGQLESRNAETHDGGSPDGARAEVNGQGRYLGLPQRDRAALQQSQGERYPQEYGTMVEQYYRNLSDERSGKQ